MNIDTSSTNFYNKKSFSHSMMLKRLELFKKKILSMEVDISSVKGLSSAAMYAYRTNRNVPKGDSLEEWGTIFGLNLNWLLWGEGSMLRDAEASVGDVQRIRDLERTVSALKEALDARAELIKSKDEIIELLRDKGNTGAAVPQAALQTPAHGTSSAAHWSRRETDHKIEDR